MQFSTKTHMSENIVIYVVVAILFQSTAFWMLVDWELTKERSWKPFQK